MSTKYKKESELSVKISKNFADIAGGESRIFRNNVGLGWSGKTKVVAKSPMTARLNPGDVVLSNARPVKYGLCKGSSDKIGFTQVEITEDMVGQTVAVFTCIEEKARKGRASKGQHNFLNFVENAGGIAVLAKSLDDLKEKIKNFGSKK